MTIRLLTIPDDPAKWAAWLEEQLVGLHLRELVEELRLDPELKQQSELPLSKLLDKDQQSGIVRHGLSATSLENIQALLANPGSLLELQEKVLEAGQPYWERQPGSQEVQESVDRVRNRLRIAPSSKNASDGMSPERSGRSKSRTMLGWIALASAALVIGVFAWPQQSGSSGRILGTPGLLADNVSSSSEYFERIAKAGNTWFDQTPRNSEDLAALLKEVSSDCEILINAPHEALTEDERTWFVTKCQNWKEKFDQTLASLEVGDLTFDDARAESDKVMLKLIQVLNAGPSV